jgi:hypothetical protein
LQMPPTRRRYRLSDLVVPAGLVFTSIDLGWWVGLVSQGVEAISVCQ